MKRSVRLLFVGLFTAMSSAAALAQAPVNLKRVPQSKPPADWPQRTSQAGPPTTMVVADRNLVLTPLAEPCRVFYRNVVRKTEFIVTGNAGFEDQRGIPGGCGIPASASAVLLTIQSTNSSAEGVLSVGPGTTPNLPAIDFRPDATRITQLMVPLSEDGRISLRPKGGTTAVRGLATGYYTQQLAAYMNHDGTLYAASKRVTGSAQLGTGVYRIDFDRDIVGCSVHVTIAGGTFYGTGYPSGPSAYINTWKLNAEAEAVPQDLYFMASVTC